MPFGQVFQREGEMNIVAHAFRSSHAAILALSLLLCACASQPAEYQAFDRSDGYGYVDERIGWNKYVVKFLANDNTPLKDQELFLLRRAAELCGGEEIILESLERISEPYSYSYVVPVGDLYLPMTGTAYRPGLRAIISCPSA